MSGDVSVPDPFSQLWSPILNNKCFRVLLTLSIAKPALSLHRGDDSYLV